MRVASSTTRLILATCYYRTIRAMATTTLNNKPAALIFLHGLGDTPAGWTALQYQLPDLRSSLNGLKYVFPPAPIIPIAINGNTRMPGWFDLYDWPVAVGTQDDPEGMQRSVKMLEDVVHKLVESGIPHSRIVLGGFSQGGAVSMQTVYRSEHRFAGCVALSGWWTPDLASIAAEAQRTPLFWGHGQYDDKVLFEQQSHGVEKLKGKGVTTLTVKQYQMGHESDPQEMQDMADFIHSVLFELADLCETSSESGASQAK